MPIYEFKCDECGAVRELMLPMSEAGQMPTCECGKEMRRKFSVIPFTMLETGKDKIMGTLNQEEGARNFPGGDKHRSRYSKAMAKGINQTRPTIGRGF